MLIHLRGVVQGSIGVFVSLDSRNGVVAAKPAVEIHIGTMGRTEGMEFLCRWLAANGTWAAWFKADGIDHHATAEGVVIQV